MKILLLIVHTQMKIKVIMKLFYRNLKPFLIQKYDIKVFCFYLLCTKT